jgi:hypothetical protein
MQETNRDGRISMQGLEHIPLKGDASAVVQRLGSTCDLRRVEFLVLVRGQGGVHVRDKCRDRQRVGGRVGRAKEVNDRVVNEIQPIFGPATPPRKTRKHVHGREVIESGKEDKNIPTQKAIAMHENEKVAVTMTGGARYAETET